LGKKDAGIPHTPPDDALGAAGGRRAAYSSGKERRRDRHIGPNASRRGNVNWKNPYWTGLGEVPAKEKRGTATAASISRKKKGGGRKRVVSRHSWLLKV